MRAADDGGGDAAEDDATHAPLAAAAAHASESSVDDDAVDSRDEENSGGARQSSQIVPGIRSFERRLAAALVPFVAMLSRSRALTSSRRSASARRRRRAPVCASCASAATPCTAGRCWRSCSKQPCTASLLNRPPLLAPVTSSSSFIPFFLQTQSLALLAVGALSQTVSRDAFMRRLHHVKRERCALALRLVRQCLCCRCCFVIKSRLLFQMLEWLKARPRADWNEIVLYVVLCCFPAQNHHFAASRLLRHVCAFTPIKHRQFDLLALWFFALELFADTRWRHADRDKHDAGVFACAPRHRVTFFLSHHVCFWQRWRCSIVTCNNILASRTTRRFDRASTPRASNWYQQKRSSVSLSS